MMGICRSQLRRSAILLFSGVVMMSCNTATRMEVPVITAPQPLVMETPRDEMVPMAFDKAVANIKRGTKIASFPQAFLALGSWGGPRCNISHQGDSSIEWSTGTAHISGWREEFGQTFFQVMDDAGYNVLGDPKELFQTATDVASADLVVGARIKEIKGNFCEHHSLFNGFTTKDYSGEFYQKIQWSVYSPMTKKVIAKFDTEGYALQTNPIKEGIMKTLLDAFAANAEALAADPGFFKIMAGVDEGEEGSAAQTKESFPPMEVDGAFASDKPLAKWSKTMLKSVVTVRRGRGHGSGFVVSRNGHILTNYHVVGKARHVQVILNSGIEVPGQVIRRDPVRDIALVKVVVRGLPPLPIRAAPKLNLLDTVYAVGSPTQEYLQSTITKGAVSAFRKEKKSGLTYIQSDVDISGGNSGGPMLDDKGNVVGVAVAGFGGVESFSAGLNLFIPIGDALTALNLDVTGKKELVRRGAFSVGE